MGEIKTLADKVWKEGRVPPNARVRQFTDLLDKGAVHDIAYYGGIGDDATDNTTAAADARLAAGTNRPIVLNNGDYNVSQTTSLYGSVFDDALGTQWLLGTAATPATRHEPVLWVEKVGECTRDVISNAWDQGAAYFSLEKTDGDAPGAAASVFAKASGTDVYDLVSLHSRARLDNADAAIWGGWDYAQIPTGIVPTRRVIGREINIQNASGVAPTYAGIGVAGEITGFAVATADGTSPGIGHNAIKISKNTGGGWVQGISIAPNSIVPSVSGDGEAIHIVGGEGAAARFGGIRFGPTSTFPTYDDLDYAIQAQGAVFGDNSAIALGDDHRIVWGSTKSSSRWLAGSATTGILTINNMALNIAAGAVGLRTSGTKVVGTRVTGWGAATGTATRTTFDTSTVTTAQLAERVKALTDDLIAHGLIGA